MLEKIKIDKLDDKVLFFMDALHPAKTTKVRSAWIRVGQNKMMESTGSRSRLKIIGALSLSNIANTTVTYAERVDTRSGMNQG